jgi:hypothetical protein
MVQFDGVPRSQGGLETEVLLRANLTEAYRPVVSSILEDVRYCIEEKRRYLIINNPHLSDQQRYRLLQALQQLIPGYFDQLSYISYSTSGVLTFEYF